MSDVGSSVIEALLPSAIDRVEAAPDWLISGSTSFGCRAWISPLGSISPELFDCLRQSGVDDGPMLSAHVYPSLRVNVRCVTPPRDDDARDQHQQQDHVEDEIRMAIGTVVKFRAGAAGVRIATTAGSACVVDGDQLSGELLIMVVSGPADSLP
jgi:hypothetical protein